MNRRFWIFATVLLLAIGPLLCVARGENIPRCPNCHRIPDREPCNWCGYSGLSGSSAGGTMQQQVIQSFGSALQQGIQQGIAAQQEAARRAAEAAAAAERRRQEILQQAAEEARVNWEQQDAANMAAFGDILSSKKKSGGGMSSLLMKQAQQSSGTWNDPNVVDMRDITNRIPQIPSGGAAATPFGSPQISGPLGVKISAAPIIPLVIPPPAVTLPPEKEFPPEYIEFIKETGGDAAVDCALILLKVGPEAESIIKKAKSSLELGKELKKISTEHLNKTFDIAGRMVENKENWMALYEENGRNFHEFCGKLDKLSYKSIRGVFGSTSEEASMGNGVINAAEMNVEVWKRQGKLNSVLGGE